MFEEGNQITATGPFTRTNGTTGSIADVLYRVDNSYTHYVGDPIAITAHAANENTKHRNIMRAA